MNYLYAKLNKEAEKLKYKGVDTQTVDMTVDNKNYTISANVKVDDALSDVSTRPVANNAIKSYVDSRHIYRHDVSISKSSHRAYFSLINTTSSAYTTVGDLPNFSKISATGYLKDNAQSSTTTYPVYCAEKDSGALGIYATTGSTTSMSNLTLLAEQAITDTVTQII